MNLILTPILLLFALHGASDKVRL